jgi:hypothetical protein
MCKCVSCLVGNHKTDCGNTHVTSDPERSDCKNVFMFGDDLVQCSCRGYHDDFVNKWDVPLLS